MTQLSNYFTVKFSLDLTTMDIGTFVVLPFGFSLWMKIICSISGDKVFSRPITVNSSRDIPRTGFRPHILHWSEHLHAIQSLPSQRRSVHMFLKSFFPISLRRADVVEVAPCASVLVNNTRQEIFG